MAKWLAASPRVILLDKPTRGADAGAKAETHALIRQTDRRGAAVVVISSALPRVMQINDRIAVITQGSVMAWRPR